MKKLTRLKFNKDGTAFQFIFSDASTSELQTSVRMAMKTLVQISNHKDYEIDKETFYNACEEIIKAGNNKLRYTIPRSRKK